VIKITIPGSPIGKGRPKFSTFGGYPKAYTPQKTVNYENLVKMAFQASGSKGYDKGIQLRAERTVYFPIPKSTSNKKRFEMLHGVIMHTKKPDADNVAKSILDALNGLAFYDDSQICELGVCKMYSDEPRAEVTIREI
jgi:Holliday junction resolvase RusA-like endonuclease